MSIDKDKIKHVSKLARISVDEKKIDSLTKDLSSIFNFIEQHWSCCFTKNIIKNNKMI